MYSTAALSHSMAAHHLAVPTTALVVCRTDVNKHTKRLGAGWTCASVSRLKCFYHFILATPYSFHKQDLEVTN
jgi:hypothetical protein